MDAQQKQVDIKKCHEALNRFCQGKEIMCVSANRTDDDLMLSDALDELERTRAQLSTVSEQLQIAVEHWEMYEDYFVDVEREACDKARQTLESLE